MSIESIKGEGHMIKLTVEGREFKLVVPQELLAQTRESDGEAITFEAFLESFDCKNGGMYFFFPCLWKDGYVHYSMRYTSNNPSLAAGDFKYRVNSELKLRKVDFRIE